MQVPWAGLSLDGGGGCGKPNWGARPGAEELRHNYPPDHLLQARLVHTTSPLQLSSVLPKRFCLYQPIQSHSSGGIFCPLTVAWRPWAMKVLERVVDQRWVAAPSAFPAGQAFGMKGRGRGRVPQTPTDKPSAVGPEKGSPRARFLLGGWVSGGKLSAELRGRIWAWWLLVAV